MIICSFGWRWAREGWELDKLTMEEKSRYEMITSKGKLGNVVRLMFKLEVLTYMYLNKEQMCSINIYQLLFPIATQRHVLCCDTMLDFLENSMQSICIEH